MRSKAILFASEQNNGGLLGYDGCRFGFAGLPVSVCVWCYLRSLDPNSKASCEGPVRKELIYDIIDFIQENVAKLEFRPQM